MTDSLGFKHLPLPMVLQGKPRLNGHGSASPQTNKNRENRISHGAYIKNRTRELSHFWRERRFDRNQQGLPPLETGIPILLEIDPLSDINFLRGLGFEIVCELENGFIIVATDDTDLRTLNEKTDEFIEHIKTRCNSPARIYALREDTDRISKILSPELYNKWSSIEDDQVYLIDIGVSCCGNIELPDHPEPEEGEPDEHYTIRERKWRDKSKAAYMKWDELKSKREEALENFVMEYGGKIVQIADGLSSIANLPDSFSARLKINSKCLRDLVLNFAYVFEVSESEEIFIEATQEQIKPIEDDVNIISPDMHSPIVCVVDSGIQENHKYIAPAILAKESKSLVSGNNNADDEVNNGGHGTRVAGAILYPKSIPTFGTYKLPCWIRNFKVLGSNNRMPMELFPPKVISEVVNIFFKESQTPTKVYNHSIGTCTPCDLKHMTPWAAEIDKQSYENDVLFVQAAGNISCDLISAYIMKARCQYPDYLEKELSRICDPAQSLQALTVGSVALGDYETEDSVSLGSKGEISSFSRPGPGIWDVIKPEVVEYGGTYVKNKESDDAVLTTPPEVCPELIRKSPEGPAFSRDAVGTSFAAPKVTHIVAEIDKVLPDSPALLYRALIAQSARWPSSSLELDRVKAQTLLRHIGYGIPDVDRATHNNDYRITLITPHICEIGEGEAHIFKIPIPEQLSSVGEDYTVLLEVTLSYAALPRRTRRFSRSYLSTWVDWCCSRIGEDSETFARRVLETGASIEDGGNFQWMIGEATNRGIIQDISRKNGTLQKDWCTIKSNQLSDAFCIAVRGHKGWGSIFKAKYTLAVSFEAINQDILIYEPIRTMVEVEVQNEEIEVEMRESQRHEDSE